MNLIRPFLAENYAYLYMNWNLFLAFVPLFFAYFFEKEHSLFLKGFTFLLFLLFLPNAVYMVTDFIHLRDIGPEWMLWYDAMMLFLYAFVGVFINAFLLSRMKRILFTTRFDQQLFLFSMTLLTAFGVYLGRYIRFNSWDVFVRPFTTIGDSLSVIGDKYNHPVFLSTMVFFTLFIMVTERAFERMFARD